MGHREGLREAEAKMLAELREAKLERAFGLYDWVLRWRGGPAYLGRRSALTTGRRELGLHSAKVDWRDRLVAAEKERRAQELPEAERQQKRHQNKRQQIAARVEEHLDELYGKGGSAGERKKRPAEERRALERRAQKLANPDRSRGEDNIPDLLALSNYVPIRIPLDESAIWCYKERFYHDPDGLSPDEVAAMIDARHLKKARSIERAKNQVAMATERAAQSAKSRDRITDEVKVFVWQRDQGRCTKCGSQADLEFDHVIPLAMGGSNTARNLQILCASCNAEKGGNLA